MRADMHKVIVGTARHAGDSRGVRARTRYQASADPDAHVYSPTTRKKLYFDYKTFNDKLTPLWNYLASQVGRPWSNVYSEICEHTRADSVLGNHLREHVRQYVVTIQETKTKHTWYQFVIDEHGFLRKRKPRTQYTPPQETRPWTKLTDTTGYLHENACWYHMMLSWADTALSIHRENPSWLWREYEAGNANVLVRKRALSSREIRKLGLRA